MEVVKGSFRIKIKQWLDSAATIEVEKFTAAALVVLADDEPICELEDLSAKTVRPDFRASAYDLALWFLANWWRLRWEPARIFRTPWDPSHESIDWRLSHQVGAVGGGFAWPDLTLVSDGRFIRIINKKTSATPISPVRYLNSSIIDVPVERFEGALDNFVEVVLARLSGVGHDDSDLARLAAELRDERQDPQLAAWRKLEATLGFDAGEAPEQLGERLLKQRSEIGESSMQEVAAAEATNAPGLLDQVRAALAASQISLRSDAIARVDFSGSYFSQDAAWKIAHRAARDARQAWGFTSGQIFNEDLEAVFGVPADVFSSVSGQPAPMPAGRRNGDSRVGIVLRSPISENRRFELMRIVGDYLIADANDHLLPVTRSRTFRQKFQRAFAQEVLCPWRELAAFVDENEPDEDVIADAARHFQVSEYVIARTLENIPRLSGDAPDEEPIIGYG